MTAAVERVLNGPEPREAENGEDTRVHGKEQCPRRERSKFRRANVNVTEIPSGGAAIFGDACGFRDSNGPFDQLGRAASSARNSIPCEPGYRRMAQPMDETRLRT